MVRMRRTLELGVLVMLVGMLLMARINCDSSVGDDEEDDEEPAVDEYETSGSSPDESSPSVDRPAVETYRDDANKQAKQQQQQLQPKQIEDHDQEQEFMDTTVDSSSNQNYQDLDSDLDQDEDTDDFADPKEPTQGGSSSSSSSSSQDNKPAQSNQPSIFTYQNNRSKLLNIIKKPGILAGIVGGAIIGILTAILLIMFIVYRMRKKDEGSYALEETKKPLNAYDYRHCPTKEFYA
jgi:syndecan 2